jgi:hypothetical protein
MGTYPVKLGRAGLPREADEINNKWEGRRQLKLHFF